MQRSFSIVDDDDDDEEVFLPEENPKGSDPDTKTYKKDNESDLSLSEASSISPKRSEDLQKLKDLDLSPSSGEEKFTNRYLASPIDFRHVSLLDISSLKDSDLASGCSSFRPTSSLLNRRTDNNQKMSHFLSESEESNDNEANSSTSEDSKLGVSESFSSHKQITGRQISDPCVPPLLLVDTDESENENKSSPGGEAKPFDESNILSPKSSVRTADILSGRQTAVLKRRTLAEPKISHLLSDSEESDEDKSKLPVPGEYNQKDYENLEVDDEIKDVFQLISRYIPQQLNVPYKFKPFIPEFLPAVGDIDAFLKVYPPDTSITGEKCTESFDHLGLTVLDEPATNQSDPAVLYLQLRAASGKPRKKHDENVVVKKIDNVEKSSKIIEKWIKDISDLHKSKSSVVVRYSEPMPDLDDLMQEWPEEVENELKKNGFPKPENMSLDEYVNTVCNKFQIPIAKNKVQSVYLLFCLYAAIKQTQLYKASSSESTKSNVEASAPENEADQLVLE